MAAQPIYFLLHVPKCAGTTVEAHFSQHLGPRYLHAPRWESLARNFVGNRYPYRPDDARLEGVRAVSGHSLSANLADHFPGREIRECVILRQPEEFFLSFWNYRMARHRERGQSRPPDFPRWYATQRRNPILRFLMNRYFGWAIPALYGMSTARRLSWLEARLARFWFVGGVQRASEMVAAVSRDLGIPERFDNQNVNADKALEIGDLDPALQARIARENRADRLLFERWRDRGWRGRGAAAPPAGVKGLARYDHLRLLAEDIVAGVARVVRT